MAENTGVKEEIARQEASVIKKITAPFAKKVIRNAGGLSPSQKDVASKFGETAFLELGSQELDNLKERDPNLYEAFMSREASLERLVESFVSEYVHIGAEHYLSPAERKQQALKAPDESKIKALKNATHLAEGLVDVISHEIVEQRRPGDSMAENLSRATSAVQKEMKENGWIKGDASPSQVAALLECSLATAEIVRLQKLAHGEKTTFNFREALEKQQAFDRSKGSK